MKMPTDDGYISDYLIHWTGVDKETKQADNEQGAKTLSKIATSRRLLLSYNDVFEFDMFNKIVERMACFTDVPLRHSREHCKRYGRFGIAFKKLPLMNNGAQPVFYCTHVWKKDLAVAFKLVLEQMDKDGLAENEFRALHRHFFFMQRLSRGRADAADADYYEREWRLGKYTLFPPEVLARPNSKHYIFEEYGLSYYGKLHTENKDTKDEKNYFDFDTEDVAFLIAPQAFAAKVDNPDNKFDLHNYEDLCTTRN